MTVSRGGGSASIQFCFAGARIDVVMDDPALDGWLQEFLRPAFSASAPSPPTATVVVVEDDGRWTAAGSAAAPFACFALDQAVVSHPGRREAESVVVDDGQFGAQYVLARGGVTVVRKDRDARSRAAVMRVVRELASAAALADGSRVLLHAAAIEAAGRVTAFVGPKGAGKTTLVTRLAGLGPALVANDRLLVGRAAGGGFVARGVPTVVSVRAGTQSLLPGRFEGLAAAPSPAHLTVAELAGMVVGDAPTVDRLKLSPRQFAIAIGADQRAGGPLGRIVVCAVDADVDAYQIETLHDVSEARRALECARFGGGRGDRPRTVFEEWLDVSRPPDADAARFADLAASVPVMLLRAGPQLLEDDGAACALLAMVADV